MATRARRPEPTEEELEILKRGSEYYLLSGQPGWKRLLGEIGRDADMALGKLRECKSSDDRTQAVLAAEWRRQELFLKELHVKVYGAIEHRKELLREIAASSGQTGQEIEGEFIMEEQTYAR